MKNVFVKIGKLLLDVIVFAVFVTTIAILGSILCAGIALVCILIPILAIYYAIFDEMSLKDSFIEQIEILIDAFNELFQSKDESD